MLSLYSKIINSPIIELHTQTQIGIVDDLVIHATKLEVYGIILKRNSFLNVISKILEGLSGAKDPKAQVIINTDILEINSQAVVANNSDAIVPTSEVIRLKEAIDQKYFGIYQRVISKKGKNIGLVYDYLVDSTTQKISKFYCRTLFTEKIIPASSVIKMEGKKIYIKDDFETIKIATPAIESSLV